MIARTAPPLLVLVLMSSTLLAQANDYRPNYDESQVPQYTLPDPLRLESGMPVTNAETWKNQRRPEVVRLFRDLRLWQGSGGCQPSPLW